MSGFTREERRSIAALVANPDTIGVGADVSERADRIASYIADWGGEYDETADEVGYRTAATLYISVDPDGDEVTRITVVPHEGDAGYFGPRLPERVWEKVSDYLEVIGDARTETDDNGEPYTVGVYPLYWEG